MGILFSRESRTIRNEREIRMAGVPQMDDVLMFIGLGRFHYILLVLSTLIFVTSFHEYLNITFSAPYLTCDINISRQTMSAIRGSALVGALFISVPWGLLVDTWGRLYVMRLSLPIVLLGNLATGLMVNTPMLAMAQIFIGVGTAGLSVSTLTYITEFYSHRHRVLFVTLAVSGYPLSRVYKAAVAYIWLPYKFSLTIVAGEFELTAWRFFVLISVPMLLFLIGSSFWLPPGPQFEMLMGRKEKTLQVLRRMYVKNTRQAPDKFIVTDITFSDEHTGEYLCDVGSVLGIFRLLWKQTYPLFQRPILFRMLMMFYLTFIMFFFSAGLYMSLPDALEMYLKSKGTVTLCAAIEEEKAGTQSDGQSVPYERIELTFFIEDFKIVGFYPIQPLATVIITKQCPFSRDAEIYFTMAILALINFLIYVICVLFMTRLSKQSVYTTWTVLIILTLFGTIVGKLHMLNLVLLAVARSGSSCASGFFALVADDFPIKYRGMALTLVLMSSQLGSICGHYVIAQLIFVNCENLFLGCSVAMMTCVPVCCILLQDPDNKIVQWL